MDVEVIVDPLFCVISKSTLGRQMSINFNYEILKILRQIEYGIANFISTCSLLINATEGECLIKHDI